MDTYEILTKEQADTNIEETLPRTDEYVDCAGIRRTFRVYRQRPALTAGYLLCADEVRDDGAGGYHFEVLAESCPFAGLASLDNKIRRELARKYLRDTDHGLQMTHDLVRGNIGHDGVIVDGRHISWDDFVKLLITHEGGKFELHVADASD